MNEIREIYIANIQLSPNEAQDTLLISLSNNILYKTKMPQKNEAQIADFDQNFE